MVVAGGILLSYCTGWYFARGQDSIIRASSMAVAAVYFASVMQIVLLVQKEIA